LRRYYSSSIRTFNKIQTQVLQALYASALLVPQLAVGRQFGRNLLSYAFGARQNNLMRYALSLSRDGRAACGGVEKEIRTTPGRQRNCSAYLRDDADLRLLEKGDVIVCTTSQVR
jgi:hypothetical protein